MKKILIAGANSYIGESFKSYLEQWPQQYEIDVIGTRGLTPNVNMFKGIDAVFCVAGIAHIKENADNRHLYFEVNRDLVVEIAKVAKESGVKQFVLLSSMSVYGIEEGVITKTTQPHPITAYGTSKLQADEIIEAFADDTFIFTCIRPPMVYGKGCTGNYRSLRKFALKTPIFPKYQNRRSMIYIGNLCCFVKKSIDQEMKGLFFPQNSEFTNTTNMVELIAAEHGKKIIFTQMFNWAIRLLPMKTLKKVFGDLVYEPGDSVDEFGLAESIRLTERD